MNMTVPFRPLRVTTHLREAEITCLPSQVSMNTPRPTDRTLPTFEAPSRTPIIGKPGRPRTRPVRTPSEPKVSLASLIVADMGTASTREIADKHGCDISYVRKVMIANGHAPLRPALVKRPDSFYLAMLEESKSASRKELKERHQMTDKQVSYCIIKGQRLKEAG